MKIPLSSPQILYCDNLSTMYMASNPILHNWSNHIEIDVHFIREKIAGTSCLRHLPTADQVTDLCLLHVNTHKI